MKVSDLDIRDLRHQRNLLEQAINEGKVSRELNGALGIIEDLIVMCRREQPIKYDGDAADLFNLE
jgi:hypothetical protein